MKPRLRAGVFLQARVTTTATTDSRAMREMSHRRRLESRSLSAATRSDTFAPIRRARRRLLSQLSTGARPGRPDTGPHCRVRISPQL